jgi:hypothetical protein
MTLALSAGHIDKSISFISFPNTASASSCSCWEPTPFLSRLRFNPLCTGWPEDTEQNDGAVFEEEVRSFPLDASSISSDGRSKFGADGSSAGG